MLPTPGASKALPIAWAPCTLSISGPRSRTVRQIRPVLEHLLPPAAFAAIPRSLHPPRNPSPGVHFQIPWLSLSPSPRWFRTNRFRLTPNRGARVTHTEGSRGVTQVAVRTGEKEWPEAGRQRLPPPFSSGHPGPHLSRQGRSPTAKLPSTETVKGLFTSRMCRWRSPLRPGR